MISAVSFVFFEQSFMGRREALQLSRENLAAHLERGGQYGDNWFYWYGKYGIGNYERAFGPWLFAGGAFVYGCGPEGV